MSAFATPPLAAVSPLFAQPGLAELVRSADRMPSGALRLETVFRYPDVASIDVFVTKPEAEGAPLVSSDLAQTFDREAYVPEDITCAVDDPVGVWREFCVEATIHHDGTLAPPPARQLELGL